MVIHSLAGCYPAHDEYASGLTISPDGKLALWYHQNRWYWVEGGHGGDTIWTQTQLRWAPLNAPGEVREAVIGLTPAGSSIDDGPTIVFSPDGRRAAAAHASGIAIVDLANGQVHSAWQEPVTREHPHLAFLCYALYWPQEDRLLFRGWSASTGFRVQVHALDLDGAESLRSALPEGMEPVLVLADGRHVLARSKLPARAYSYVELELGADFQAEFGQRLCLVEGEQLCCSCNGLQPPCASNLPAGRQGRHRLLALQATPDPGVLRIEAAGSP